MEKDMYPIIKKHLEQQGYHVKAEVKDSDVVGIKEDVIIIIEMKSSFTIKLIYQGLKSKGITEYIYLAIPKPTNKIIKSATFKEKIEIIKHLELGLLFVDKDLEKVIVVHNPETVDYKTRYKKRNNLKKEFFLRKTSFNVGGVNRTKIITAYREIALVILYFLKDGPKKVNEIKNYTKQEKTMSILQKNFYGWFERIDRGIYKITKAGEEALVIYLDVIENLIENL